MWWRHHDVLQVHEDRIEAGQRMLEDARQRKISRKWKKKATKAKKINQVNRKKGGNLRTPFQYIDRLYIMEIPL